MIVLGIHYGHDSSAALIKDGEIIADVAEERFTRLKHCNNVPMQSIGYCLKAANIKNINDVDKVAFSWKDTPIYVSTLLGLPESGERSIKRIAGSFFGRSFGVSRIKPPIYFPNLELVDPSKFINVEHHFAHAASAHFTRKSADKCLIFTVDGAGDECSTAVWLAEGTKITPLEKLYREASIGWAYSIVTEALHWWHGDGEGKTMGLAPYGDWTACKGVLDEYFPVFNGVDLVKPTKLGKSYYWIENSSTQFHFDEAKAVEELCVKYGRENIAAEAQRKLEEVLLEYIFGWVKKTGVSRTAYSGGVFLNVKLNQRVWYNRGTAITEQHVFPNCGDSGLAIGAALAVFHQDKPFVGIDLNNLYWGPEYSDQEIEEILKLRKIKYVKLDNPTKTAAEYLAANKIIAWFQGRMESGPRALGNRSILMSPLLPENKDVINARVKFREAFRPFCPSLLWEKRDVYLKDARDEYFMITSFDVTDEKRDKVPAVVHVDGTLRPQLVKADYNRAYWNVINEFGKLTGEYILLNTSFNIRGEPVIQHPSEAIRCLYDTGLDALFLGSYLIEK